jgi:hypothetical protein
MRANEREWSLIEQKLMVNNTHIIYNKLALRITELQVLSSGGDLGEAIYGA